LKIYADTHRTRQDDKIVKKNIFFVGGQLTIWKGQVELVRGE